MTNYIPVLVALIAVIGTWLLASYIMYCIGRKFEIGSFLEYCIPVYNMFLICRCADVSPWNILGLFIPIVQIYFSVHIWGSVAERLEKNYWLYGIGSLPFFFYITLFFMAFDNSRPPRYTMSVTKDKDEMQTSRFETISSELDNFYASNKEEQEQAGSSYKGKYSSEEKAELSKAFKEDKMDSETYFKEDIMEAKTDIKGEKKAKSNKAVSVPGLDILSKIGLRTINELIGFDIGSTSIKVCVLKKVRDGFEIQTINKKTYDKDILSDGNLIDYIFISEELKKIITENKIKCKNAACALSSYTVITKKIELPFIEDEEELENSIRMEVESVIPFPLKDIYYSYYVLGMEEGKEDAMNIQIVAAKKEIVDSYISAFSMAGLNLQILDIDIFGVTNLIEQIYDTRDFSVVAVDIGASITNIAIMKGDNLEFTREILMGGKYLTNQIEKSTKLSHIEAEEKKIAGDNDVLYLFEDFIFNISSEITKTINFYTATNPNDSIGKIYLTGGSSKLQGLKDKIEEDTHLEAEFMNPFLLLNEGETKYRAYENYGTFIDIALYLSSRITDLGQ